mmetsp:Transcript_25749/g.70800  ORF Transcript_25749/g.70800 Transcript_25749/m.70800 type:complete len:290 (+) Transcript_25749:52-921(+)
MTCLFLDGDSLRSGNDDGGTHVAKESVVDDTADGLDVFGHLSCVLDGFLEVEVDNVVSIVGDGDFVSVGLVAGGGSHSEDGFASRAGFEGGNLSHGVFVAERCDLNGNGESGSQSIAQLGFVDDDDEFVGHDFDHLLSKKSTASSLDKVQVGVNLVGSIDSNIQLRVGVEGDKRDIEAFGLFLGADRSGNADNIFQLSGFQELSDALDGEVCGGTSSKTDNHSTSDVVIDGLVADLFLEFVLRNGRHTKSRLETCVCSKCHRGKCVDTRKRKESGGNDAHDVKNRSGDV